MTKKPSRVRILMMPYHDDGDKDPVGYSGPATVLTGLPRTIRRHELRLIVPLAESTIYESRGNPTFLANNPNRRILMSHRSDARGVHEGADDA